MSPRKTERMIVTGLLGYIVAGTIGEVVGGCVSLR